MKLLLHMCCAPCSLFPLKKLLEEKIQTTGFFFNPNIHPFREFKKRKEGVRDITQIFNVNVKINQTYGLQEYLREVVFNEQKRCTICYTMRLKATAAYAYESGYDAFSTTLLYSKYQNHRLIKEIGEKLALQYSTKFHYCDYRVGWDKGVEESIRLNLYRQSYCGCIYSEQERYDKLFRKIKKGFFYD